MEPWSLDKRSHLRVALSLRHRMQEMHWTATCASMANMEPKNAWTHIGISCDIYIYIRIYIYIHIQYLGIYVYIYDGISLNISTIGEMCFSYFLFFLHDALMDTASQLKAPPEPGCPSHPNPRCKLNSFPGTGLAWHVAPCCSWFHQIFAPNLIQLRHTKNIKTSNNH